MHVSEDLMRQLNMIMPSRVTQDLRQLKGEYIRCCELSELPNKERADYWQERALYVERQLKSALNKAMLQEGDS